MCVINGIRGRKLNISLFTENNMLSNYMCDNSSNYNAINIYKYMISK